MIYKLNGEELFEIDDFVYQRLLDRGRYSEVHSTKKDLFSVYDKLLKHEESIIQVATGTEFEPRSYERIFTDGDIPDFRLSNLRKTKKANGIISKKRVDRKEALRKANIFKEIQEHETEIMKLKEKY
jgi:hypothetical protein